MTVFGFVLSFPELKDAALKHWSKSKILEVLAGLIDYSEGRDSAFTSIKDLGGMQEFIDFLNLNIQNLVNKKPFRPNKGSNNKVSMVALLKIADHLGEFEPSIWETFGVLQAGVALMCWG